MRENNVLLVVMTLTTNARTSLGQSTQSHRARPPLPRYIHQLALSLRCELLFAHEQRWVAQQVSLPEHSLLPRIDVKVDCCTIMINITIPLLLLLLYQL